MKTAAYADNQAPQVGDLVTFASEPGKRFMRVTGVGGGRLGNKVTVKLHDDRYEQEYYYHVLLKVTDLELARATAFAINSFGDGQHAVATEANLKSFCSDYAFRCLTKMIESDVVNTEGHEAARAARDAVDYYCGR